MQVPICKSYFYVFVHSCISALMSGFGRPACLNFHSDRQLFRPLTRIQAVTQEMSARTQVFFQPWNFLYFAARTVKSFIAQDVWGESTPQTHCRFPLPYLSLCWAHNNNLYKSSSCQMPMLATGIQWRTGAFEGWHRWPLPTSFSMKLDKHQSQKRLWLKHGKKLLT